MNSPNLKYCTLDPKLNVLRGRSTDTQEILPRANQICQLHPTA
jgi:hypothetical protein